MGLSGFGLEGLRLVFGLFYFIGFRALGLEGFGFCAGALGLWFAILLTNVDA